MSKRDDSVDPIANPADMAEEAAAMAAVAEEETTIEEDTKTFSLYFLLFSVA
jgi:hypothetical protein